ncbi:MAG TPA: Na+/H+ antiporter NhaA [Acidimicrobiales bacterium]|nr:Na+/H+ antiporter NhaA [Acidimicrobiales bacterium]
MPHRPTPSRPAAPVRLAQTVWAPVRRFLQVEAAGGAVLAAAVVVALVWASSPWSSSYERLWTTELALGVGGHSIGTDLRHWLDDGLMTLFFFVIGLEIRRELTDGHLASVRAAAVPALGAVGGMVVPALAYLAVNAGGEGAHGWGIPMATDVAFAVGVLALLGSRAPTELKVLLLALAIVDDIGAVVVIAAFYSEGLDLRWALVALAGLGVVVAARVAGLRIVPAYVVLGTVVWFATWRSGVHATIAGVALGLLTPARPQAGPDGAEAPSVAQRLQDRLHPWTSFVVVPLFALANAGIELSADALGDAATSPVSLGVVVGLVLGKPVGVVAAVLLATRLGLGHLPPGLSTRQVVGLGTLAGIGFTVSLFVAGRAFPDPVLAGQAKVGILAASLVAAAVGAAVLWTAGRSEEADPAAP